MAREMNDLVYVEVEQLSDCSVKVPLQVGGRAQWMVGVVRHQLESGQCPLRRHFLDRVQL